MGVSVFAWMLVLMLMLNLWLIFVDMSMLLLLSADLLSKELKGNYKQNTRCQIFYLGRLKVEPLLKQHIGDGNSYR